jgi:hypothetical protein
MGKKYSEMTEEEKQRRRDIQKKYRLKNPEKVKERKKKWRNNNIVKAKEISKKSKLRNQEKLKEYRREYYQKNKESRIAKSKEWMLNNREKRNLARRQRYQKIKEKQKERSKQWRLNNPEKRNDYEKRRRIKIVDNYVKTNLIAKGFPKETITPELIEVQRLIIKTKRLTKNKLKEQENEKHSRT